MIYRRDSRLVNMTKGMWILFFYILTSYINSAESRGKDWLCPPQTLVCQCHSKHRVPYLADCSNRNLTSLPKFQQKYQKLKFSGNNIEHLGKATFINVRSWNLSELYLNNSNIKFVDEDTFRDLNLNFIDFSKNKGINITQLSRSFRNQNLIGIDLSDISLGNAGVTEFFNTTASDTLQFVRVASCNITHLTADMFKHLQNLIELDLSRNNIKAVDLTILPPVQRLVLKNMELSEMPHFDKSTLVSLNIGYNRISNLSVLDKKGHLLADLKYLYADNNPLTTLSKQTFGNLNKLYSLSLCNVTSDISDFQGISSKTLKYFNFSRNVIEEKYANVFFQNTTNLYHLILKDTSLKTWSEKNVSSLIKPLRSELKTLRLVRTYFQTIPSDVLRLFQKLEILDLSSNNIAGWQDTAFINITIRKQILLKNNLIHVINETSFPDNILNKPVPFLDFRGNPFSCTCEAHWFRNWMKGQYYKIRGSRGDNFLCHSPSSWKGQQFVAYDPYYEDCNGLNYVVIAGLAICGFCMSFMTLTLYGMSLYKKRELSHKLEGYSVLDTNT